MSLPGTELVLASSADFLHLPADGKLFRPLLTSKRKA